VENNLWKKVIRNSHRRLVFPYAVFSTEKEVTIEHGFNIGMLFFEDLLPLVISIIDLKGHWMSHSYTILEDYGYSVEWKEAVLRIAGSAGYNKLSIKALFSILIEFSKIMYTRYNFELDYLLDLLEAMQKNPSKFLLKAKLWEEVIKNSYSVRSLYRRGFIASEI